MEEYISHQDYKKMLGSFGKQAPKKVLNEMHTMEKEDGPREFHKLPADIEEDLENEGNAFTAGLAKTKKGGEFKVGNKKFKDKTNYDSNLEEYQFDQMYPDDPGPFEGKDVDDMIKEFLVREDDVNWDRMDDEEAEENETDNGIEEDINLPSSQATGPSIEENKRPLSHLTSEERDQLKQYVETIKTVKGQINKMVNKSGMEEGGNMTNLIMRPSKMREDDEMTQGGGREEIESKLNPKLHHLLYKVVGLTFTELMAAGFDGGDIKNFIQHEIEEKAKQYIGQQYPE